jgi:hypothetical protein
MKAVSADFKPSSRPGWPLWVLAFLVASAASASTVLWWRQNQELTQLQTLLQTKKAQRQVQVTPPPALAIAPKPYDRSAREMLAERQAPWPDALAVLESAAQVGVTPRAVDFNAAEGAVRVELVVNDPTRLLKYIEALNAGVDKDPKELRWSLLQTQLEPASGITVAVIIGKRPAN